MMLRIQSGESVIRERKAGRASIIMQAMVRNELRGRRRAVAILGTIAVLGLCAFQFADRNESSKMQCRHVQRRALDRPKPRNLGKQGNIDLLVGETEPGKTVT